MTSRFGFASLIGAFSNSNIRRAETFTVGVAGILSEVDVLTSGISTFTGFNILSTTGGTPTMTVLATGTLASQSASDATFTVSLAVTVGEVLAIEPIGIGFWLVEDPNTYTGGQDFFVNPSFGYTSFTPGNAVPFGMTAGDDFRTFVTVPSPVTVPEPSSMALLGISLAGIVATRRRAAA